MEIETGRQIVAVAVAVALGALLLYVVVRLAVTHAINEARTRRGL